MMSLSADVHLSPEAVFREFEPLARKTTFRVGGRARYYAEPASPDDLMVLLRFAKREELQPVCFGRGSNLLVADGDLPVLVVRFLHPYWREMESLGDGRVRVGAGLRLQELCAQAARLELGGFEFLEGIPGTVGGALRMNAGAMNGAMFDIVDTVRLIGLADGAVKELQREQLQFGYRHCGDLREAFAVDAVLRSSGTRKSEEIRAIIAEFRGRRKSCQPRESSAGCVFKNPEGDSAGRLIDAAGLKGFCVGGAEISPVHGNFIVNKGDATCGDILELIRHVRERVQAVHAIELEPEIQLLGCSWKGLEPKT